MRRRSSAGVQRREGVCEDDCSCMVICRVNMVVEASGWLCNYMITSLVVYYTDVVWVLSV